MTPEEDAKRLEEEEYQSFKNIINLMVVLFFLKGLLSALGDSWGFLNPFLGAALIGYIARTALFRLMERDRRAEEEDQH